MDFPDRLEVVIEVSRGGFIKRTDDGGVDFVSPFPCPFNYGSVPDTCSGDGDRLDALVLGASVPRGTRLVCRVLGRVRFVDAGLEDPKYICALLTPGPEGVHHQGRLAADERARIERFFAFYARAKRVLNALRGKSGETTYGGIDLR